MAQKCDSSQVRKPGRPRTADDLQALILRMARETRSWGYARIQGALRNLGHEVGRGMIAEILRTAGLDPAPERMNRTSWKEFLRTHWRVLAATDFFTVEIRILQSAGIPAVRLSPRSPNLNAYAGRFVRSIK